MFTSKELLKNKKAYSTGFSWLFGLFGIFALGLMFLIFNQVFTVYLNPVIKTMTNESTDINDTVKGEIDQGINKWMSFFRLTPFVIFFMVIFYVIVSAIRHEKEGQYE